MSHATFCPFVGYLRYSLSTVVNDLRSSYETGMSRKRPLPSPRGKPGRSNFRPPMPPYLEEFLTLRLWTTAQFSGDAVPKNNSGLMVSRSDPKSRACVRGSPSRGGDYSICCFARHISEVTRSRALEILRSSNKLLRAGMASN